MVEIYIPSEVGYEKVAISAVAVLAKKIGFSVERIEDLKTALAEAVTNAIEHGNQLKAEIRVLIGLTIQEKALMLNIVDQGYQPIPDIPAERQERVDNRGLGMFLMKSLMDEVEFIVRPGYNEVRMVAYLEG